MHRFRVWMDKERFASNSLMTMEYAAGLTEFMTLAGNQESCLTSETEYCLVTKSGIITGNVIHTTWVVVVEMFQIG
ncbi:unnamed protein product [Arabidopsis halleri]